MADPVHIPGMAEVTKPATTSIVFTKELLPLFGDQQTPCQLGPRRKYVHDHVATHAKTEKKAINGNRATNRARTNIGPPVLHSKKKRVVIGKAVGRADLTLKKINRVCDLRAAAPGGPGQKTNPRTGFAAAKARRRV